MKPILDASGAVIGYENDVSPYRQEIRDRAVRRQAAAGRGDRLDDGDRHRGGGRFRGDVLARPAAVPFPPGDVPGDAAARAALRQR